MMPWEDDACGCGHPWEEHSLEVGCRAGWEYSSEGVAVRDGCECKLAHVQRSNHDG